MKKTVLVDVDGVLAAYDGWKGVDYIGEPLPGAVEFTHELSRDYTVVIYTTRCSEEMHKPEKAHLLVNRVKAWLDKHGFAYDHIYSEQGKPICSAIVDDRAVCCRHQFDGSAAYAETLARVRKIVGQGSRKSRRPSAARIGDTP